MSTFSDSFASKFDNQTKTTHQPEFRHNPKSFLKLILSSFSIVGLPLIIALIYSASRIDQLADHSRATIYQATQMIYGGRALIDETIVMRRSIEHAHILEDISLLDSYFQSHDKFEKIAFQLVQASPHLEQRLILEKLRLLETTIFREVLTLDDTLQDSSMLIDKFDLLFALSNIFSTESQRLIGIQVNEIGEMASQVRLLIKGQLLILIPFVILLALFLSFLIARPLRQIDEAIDNLGQGKLSNTVHVDGPQNLKYLGSRLDWMRRRLLKLEEQKIQFLRHISHELKTPLTAIREGANLLAEGVAGDLNKKQQLIADILRGSSVLLQKRIEDLLSFSALQTDKSALIKQRTNLARIVTDVLKNQNLSIISRKICIDLACPDLLLECDKQKISVIIDNLVSNAIKFSPPESCIRITAIQVDQNIQFDIIDSGIGVDKTERNKVFEPFYQGRSIPNSYIKGTGLGLSIAREYVLAHEGNIELIDHDGQGAHFRLTLPAYDPETRS
ncbi:MAG: HAMP domain-containing histidine kinase [Nitrosomonas sp.]|nr:HAMP domain-containing histidine kinase [Nitrosomonas sp.]MCW5607418.1 HAMP domain-containing histidine kinase [Nitrosomonas sp.]